MTIDNTLTPWAKRNILRTENDRDMLDGKDSIEGFGWLHLPCGDSVVEEKVGGGIRKVCNKHKVSSAVELLKR
ncbi:MAG: hypothetical protein AAB622_02565 [Patescibacteria group bacterium]